MNSQDQLYKDQLYQQLRQDHTPITLAYIAQRIVKAEEERDELRNLLLFAILNSDKFTEHDSDGAKAAWIERARELFLKE